MRKRSRRFDRLLQTKQEETNRALASSEAMQALGAASSASAIALAATKITGSGNTPDTDIQYIYPFTNSDLVSGYVTITHEMDQQYVSVQVFNNDDRLVIPDDVQLPATNTVVINLSGFAPISGTWRAVIQSL